MVWALIVSHLFPLALNKKTVFYAENIQRVAHWNCKSYNQLSYKFIPSSGYVTNDENTTNCDYHHKWPYRELYDLKPLQVQCICSIISYNNKIGKTYASFHKNIEGERWRNFGYAE